MKATELKSVSIHRMGRGWTRHFGPVLNDDARQILPRLQSLTSIERLAIDADLLTAEGVDALESLPNLCSLEIYYAQRLDVRLLLRLVDLDHLSLLDNSDSRHGLLPPSAWLSLLEFKHLESLSLYTADRSIHPHFETHLRTALPNTKIDLRATSR